MNKHIIFVIIDFENLYKNIIMMDFFDIKSLNKQ